MMKMYFSNWDLSDWLQAMNGYPSHKENILKLYMSPGFSNLKLYLLSKSSCLLRDSSSSDTSSSSSSLFSPSPSPFSAHCSGRHLFIFMFLLFLWVIWASYYLLQIHIYARDVWIEPFYLSMVCHVLQLTCAVCTWWVQCSYWCDVRKYVDCRTCM